MTRRPPRSTLSPHPTLFRSAGGAPADFTNRTRVYHKASDRHYTMVERNGRFYQRRHQVGFKGEEANALEREDRKSTRLNSSHANISYAVFCLKKKKKQHD